MRSRRRPRCLVLVVLLAMTACGGSDSGRPAESPEGTGSRGPGRAVIDAPGGSTTTRGVTTTAASRFEFVDYLTSDGAGGVAKSLKVWPDGRAICTRGTERVDFSVPAAAVTELRTALERADLAALPPVNGTPTPEATVFRLIFGGQAVRFVSGSMPPPLGPAVAILDRILARECP